MTLLLFAFQMVGAWSPPALLPGRVFVAPFVPTREGQYIIKNVVLIGAAMVIGATMRGGHLVADAGEEQVERRGRG